MLILQGEHFSMRKFGFVILCLVFCFNSSNFSKNTEQSLSFHPDSTYKELALSIDSVLSNKNLGSTQLSIAIYSLNEHKFIYEKNPYLPLKPASLTKLLTSFATYSLVSDTFNLRTQIYTDDNNIDDGIVNGNLYILGGGDCLMKLADLDELVQQIENLGIKKITGDIIADGRLYNGDNNRFAYSGDNDEVEPVAPISALTLEQNRFRIFVNSRVTSQSPKIQIIPNAGNVQVVSNVKIYAPAPAKKKSSKKKAKKSSSNFQICEQNYGDRIPLDVALLSTYRNRISAHSKLKDDGTQIIYLSGTMPKNKNLGIQEFILSPNMSFASVFRNRLISNGINVSGKFDKVSKSAVIDYPNMKKIAEFARPLNELIKQMNKNSDNYLAENLFKFNGAIACKDTATVVSAKRLYDSIYSSIVKPEQLPILNDGSGLSRRNRASAYLLVNMLAKASQSKIFSSYVASLSIAGVDGTLAKRLRGTTAENNLMGKTGTHRDVSGLAGYIHNLDGEIYLFAYIFNGPNVGLYKNLENELSLILSNHTKYKLNEKPSN